MIRNQKSLAYLGIGVGFLIIAALVYMFHQTTPYEPYNTLSPRPSLLILCAFNALAGFACLGASVQKAMKGPPPTTN